MDITSLLFSFAGRINRGKYWLGVVILIVVYIIIGVIGAVTGGMSADGMPSGAVGIVLLLIYIATIWPSLALGVKRFHDRNKSGWWVLIALVPIIGGLWYLIECGFLPGTQGANQYGADPLAAG